MNVNEQNQHPLYQEAQQRFLRAEVRQNAKAAAKYPGPLNPASWSASQLADHYAEESVDQGRYVEALRAKCEMLEDAIRAVLPGLQELEDGECEDVEEFARRAWLRLARNLNRGADGA